MKRRLFATIALVRRPKEFVEGTRWLFTVLAVASLIMTVVVVLPSASMPVRIVLLVSSAVLVSSLMACYLRRGASWQMEVIDGLATLTFALASADPGAIVGFVCVLQWFRCLYSSMRADVLRAAVYLAILGLSALAGSRVPGATGQAIFGPTVGIVPTLIAVLLVLVGPSLAETLKDRERSALLDAVHTCVGSQLLDDTDEVTIRQIADRATVNICAAIPGLRVLGLLRTSSAATVDGAAGEFAAVPSVLPVGVFFLPGGDCESAQEAQLGRAALDTAAGATCEWVYAPQPHQPDEPVGGRLLLGAPGAVPAEALVAISGLINQVTLALRNNAAHRALTALATLDGLTGLSNRMTFNTSVATALAEETDPHPTVLFVDLDDFKGVNDQFGHAAGDDLLREVAARLRSVTRSPDLCARIGGDEFAVLLRGARTEAAAQVAHRIVSAIAAPVPIIAGVVVGASVGVATATDETIVEELIHHADVAMYAAKNSGKGRVQIFHPGLLNHATS